MGGIQTGVFIFVYHQPIGAGGQNLGCIISQREVGSRDGRVRGAGTKKKK
jgi:hypothetical protein